MRSFLFSGEPIVVGVVIFLGPMSFFTSMSRIFLSLLYDISGGILNSSICGQPLVSIAQCLRTISEIRLLFGL